MNGTFKQILATIVTAVIIGWLGFITSKVIDHGECIAVLKDQISANKAQIIVLFQKVDCLEKEK